MASGTLKRFLGCSHGTFGKLVIKGRSRGEFFTMEEEPQGNKPRISCIPAGTYICKRARYNKTGLETFEVTGVPGRSQIKIHPANTEEDVEGCIAPGMSLAVLDVRDEDIGVRGPKLAVAQSKLAHALFMSSLKGVDEFPLEITDPVV